MAVSSVDVVFDIDRHRASPFPWREVLYLRGLCGGSMRRSDQTFPFTEAGVPALTGS